MRRGMGKLVCDLGVSARKYTLRHYLRILPRILQCDHLHVCGEE